MFFSYGLNSFLVLCVSQFSRIKKKTPINNRTETRSFWHGRLINLEKRRGKVPVKLLCLRRTLSCYGWSTTGAPTTLVVYGTFKHITELFLTILLYKFTKSEHFRPDLAESSYVADRRNIAIFKTKSIANTKFNGINLVLLFEKFNLAQKCVYGNCSTRTKLQLRSKVDIFNPTLHVYTIDRNH